MRAFLLLSFVATLVLATTPDDQANLEPVHLKVMPRFVEDTQDPLSAQAISRQKNCGGAGVVCQGGKCNTSGKCVKNALTSVQVFSITIKVNQWFDQAVATDKVPGDTVAALLRAGFHDFAGGAKAQGCLLVECEPDQCERFTKKNKGMEEVISKALDIYWSNNFARWITLADYFHLVIILAIKRASAGAITIPFRWGRDVCPGLNNIPPLTLPLFPDEALPEPDDTFDTFADNFENRMGLTRQEWICLIGAHGIGRCEPTNLGYARSWSLTHNVLDNNFYSRALNGSLIWDIEEGEVVLNDQGVQDENVPSPPEFQYHLRDSGHSGTMFLPSDLNTFWIAEPDLRCPVTHNAQGCGLRLSGPIQGFPQVPNNNGEFHLLKHFATNAGDWRKCFTAAYTKMIEKGHSNLRSVLSSGY